MNSFQLNTLGISQYTTEPITIFIHGNPVPQARPKFFRSKRGFVGAYEPQNSRSWKDTVRSQLIDAMNKRNIPIISVPIHLSLSFFFTKPKSLPKKVKFHTKKPDLDNLIKSLADAMSSIIITDDNLIVSLYALKTYCIPDDPSLPDFSKPGVEIIIKTLP